jgi:hypothetical protein
MCDQLTSYEVARRTGDSDAGVIVELLNMSNQMMLDLPNTACNNGELHRSLIRDTYPIAEVHGYNEGVGNSASQTRQVEDGLMMMSQYSIVDKRLADDSGQKDKIRWEEAQAFILGMGVQLADRFIYADKAARVTEINGLATRLKSPQKDPKHVIPFISSEGITGNEVTSLYVAAAGPKLLHLLHNRNFGNAGIKREDKGEQVWDYGNGKHGQVYVDYFTAQMGIAVEHPDAVFRICNIPVDGSLTAEQRAALVRAVLHVQKLLPPDAGTVCLYGNLGVEELVEQAARDIQIHVSPEKDPWGNPVNLINGMRVRRMDVIKTGASEKLSGGDAVWKEAA